MPNLIIPLEELLKRSLERTFEIDPARLELDDADYQFNQPVRGRVTFRSVCGDVIGAGHLSTIVRTRCYRCLAPVDAPIEVDVNETWLTEEPPAPGGIDEEVEGPLTHRLEDDRIDLTEVFRELVMTELPDRVLCGRDCRGLCPGCGANLNAEPCRCPAEEKKKREENSLPDWKQKLKNIKLDE